ncbi:hypothetical protein, partial [Roseovarius aestuariivivens]|uniref:hypothetical protein n=1 Tax=Roseovarius aestuariivivens TaxID=1888910 RepID=UPI001AEBE212
MNNTNHQYSDREARPEKVTYFTKQVLMASVNDIFGLISSYPIALRTASPRPAGLSATVMPADFMAS